MGYKVVSRIKDEQSDSGYLERGESVKKSDFKKEKDWEDLLTGRSVVTDQEFNALFPNFGDDGAEEEENDPTGTPSNLQQIEGTKLAASEQKEPPKQEDKKETPAK